MIIDYKKSETLETNVKDHHITSTYEKEGKTLEVVTVFNKRDNFEKMSFSARHSPCWLSITIQRIKNNRSYDTHITLDKEHLQNMVNCLQEICNQLSPVV